MVGGSKASEQKSRDLTDLPPVGQEVFRRPTVRQSVPGGSVRASLHHAPPRTPLRYALHTLPAFRPPQAAANFSQWCFVGIFHFIGAHSSHMLRAAPPCRARSSHRIAAPVPPPVAMASSVVLVIPGASAFVPHLCSLVIPAGTLDAAPSGGMEQLSFVLIKQTSPDFQKSSYRRLKKEGGLARWVSVVVGPGKHHSNPSHPGGDRSNRNPLPRAKPSPSPSLGSFGSVIANAPPPLIAPPTGKEDQEALPCKDKKPSAISTTFACCLRGSFRTSSNTFRARLAGSFFPRLIDPAPTR